MKPTVLFKKQKLFALIISFCYLSAMQSCESSLSEVAPTENGALLTISISGIEEEIVSSLATARAAAPANEMTNPTESTQLISIENTDIFIQSKLVQAEPLSYTGKDPGNPRSNTLRSSLGQQAATSLMANGVRYRLIIFNQDNIMVVNQVATSGTNPQIRVDGHRNFTWYALSLNETNTTVPDINSSGTITRTSLANKDVLYASGSISTVDGDNYLAIVFRRLTARFRVRLDVRGVFGTVSGNTSLSLLKNTNNTGLITMGDLNIRTGAFANITRYPNTTVSNEQMQNVEGTPTGSTKYANFYTLDTEAITANNLKVTLNRLDITLDDNSTRSFTTATTVSYTNAYTPRIGTTYELTLGMVEQAIRVDGILWARTNLIYDASKTDRYRLKTSLASSGDDEINTDYWNWMSTTPTGATGSTDPCTLIYPNGTWRMPTQAEWRAIGNPDTRHQQSYLIWAGGTRYAYEWNLDSDYPPNNAYNVNSLFIAFGGYRVNNDIQESPWGVATFGSGECHYWSSTASTGNTAIAFRSSFSTALFFFSWGDITIGASNRAEGQNIRCVRQVSN